MKALLLRVGIDLGYGALSPVFNDNTYEFIPIYYKNLKENEKNEIRTYNELNSNYKIDKHGKQTITNKGNLTQYLPQKIHNKIVHLDPEFESYTYGEPNHPKRAALLKLNEGDILAFYLGGHIWNMEPKINKNVYLFSYFIVKKVYDWDNLTKNERLLLSKTELKNNAHIISSKSKNNLVVVKGDPSRSKKLKKCICISEKNRDSNNPPYLTSRKIKKLIGIRDHITRAVPLWITRDKYLDNFKNLLGIKDL